MDTSQVLADNYDSESETSETRRNKPVRNKVKKEPKKIKEETKDQKIMRAINRTAPGDLPPSKFFNPVPVRNQGYTGRKIRIGPGFKGSDQSHFTIAIIVGKRPESEIQRI